MLDAQNALIVPAFSRLITIPLVSTIGAARRFDELPIEGFLDVPKPKGARNSDRYCSAAIMGDSLIERGINDGDIAVIRLTFDANEFQQGQLLAVRTPHGLLLKFVYWTLKGKVRLVSANPKYEDILLDAEDVSVQGVVEYTMHYWR
ncbi:MAG: S24 family peptidase [Blastocatellia bacterium]